MSTQPRFPDYDLVIRSVRALVDRDNQKKLPAARKAITEEYVATTLRPHLEGAVNQTIAHIARYPALAGPFGELDPGKGNQIIITYAMAVVNGQTLPDGFLLREFTKPKAPVAQKAGEAAKKGRPVAKTRDYNNMLEVPAVMARFKELIDEAAKREYKEHPCHAAALWLKPQLATTEGQAAVVALFTKMDRFTEPGDLRRVGDYAKDKEHVMKFLDMLSDEQFYSLQQSKLTDDRSRLRPARWVWPGTTGAVTRRAATATIVAALLGSHAAWRAITEPADNQRPGPQPGQGGQGAGQGGQNAGQGGQNAGQGGQGAGKDQPGGPLAGKDGGKGEKGAGQGGQGAGQGGGGKQQQPDPRNRGPQAGTDSSRMSPATEGIIAGIVGLYGGVQILHRRTMVRGGRMQKGARETLHQLDPFIDRLMLEIEVAQRKKQGEARRGG